jgi:hypothetical protein
MTTGLSAGRQTTRRRAPVLGAALLVLEVLVAYALVGLVAGLVWEAVWVPPDQVVQQHQVYAVDYASLRRMFTGTGLYVLVAAVASTLTALVVSLLTRRRELVVLVAVALGSGVAAGVMREVGISRGPVDPTTLAASAADGVHLPGALDVSGFSPYLVWPMMSLLVLAVVFFSWPRALADRRDAGDSAPRSRPAVDLPPARQQLAERIGSAEFTPTRIRRGYDMGAVDGLLDSAVAAVTRGEPLAPLLDVTLPTVTWREGYDMAEVTAFLDSLRVSAHGMDPRK